MVRDEAKQKKVEENSEATGEMTLFFFVLI